MKTSIYSVVTVLLISASIDIKYNHVNAEEYEQVNVWGESLNSQDAGYTNPTTLILPRDTISINAVTTEDLVKFEPSLVIRRRFIGDSNGTLGMRGSNMFQTSRSMVFADGVPLHYLLQSRWNGAPRWTMVSASEIKKVEVVYGPFSAEYSGNAMGGVVLIETGIPQQQEFYADINAFVQEFDDYGFDDTIDGYKGFASYGNKVGDLSYYISFNHLDSDSQPQTFRGASRDDTGEIDVIGGIQGVDSRDREQLWYGDTGIVHTQTQNYKAKLGYEFNNWQALLNLAFEDRRGENSGNSYIRDMDTDATLWQGDNLVSDGYAFSFNSSRLNETLRDRESLSAGLRLKGKLSNQTRLEINLNQFDILHDESRSSLFNPSDPSFTLDGRINAYENSGWQTAEMKLVIDNFLSHKLEFITGVRHEGYELNLDQFDSDNYRAGEKNQLTSRFGGKTQIDALFVQANWDISQRWDLAIGLRYESFGSEGGYYSEQSDEGDSLNIITAPSVDAEKTSPKLSLGYVPQEAWLVRYSIAKAYRFPIVEELFRQYEDYNSVNESNPELRPEDGLHHNLMIEKTLKDGYVRVNVFHENIEDAIESQSTTTLSGQSISTFVPLDETRATGAELVFNTLDLVEGLDLRFNLTYTDTEIVENSANSEWEGNDYPRMPKWRSNLLATYHFSDNVNTGLSVQYASDSYGRVQNDDTVDEVYGAQDAYTRIGLKANYMLNNSISLNIGVDNLSNEVAYVAHPWPGRTFYLGASYKL